MAEENLRRLTATRGAHRGQMTKLISRAEGLITQLETPSVSQTYSVLYDSIISKLNTLKTCDRQIIDNTETDRLEDAIVESDDYITEFEISIGHLKAALDLSSQQVPAADNFSTHSTSTSDRDVAMSRNVNKLPKLQLPLFDGNFLKWGEFNDAFTSAVDNNEHIDNVQKFQYLKAQLRGDAARTIEGLQVTNANYNEALTLLKKRFGQTHILISQYMKALWELPKPDDSVDSLHEFYDSLESYVRGLHALGKTEETYGELLVPIIFEKLPGNVITQISRDHGDTSWSIKELRQALDHEIQAARAGQRSHYPNQYGANHNSTAAFHVQNNHPKTCVFCKNSHYPNDCPTVTDKQARIDIIKRNRLCFNCLKRGHTSKDCMAKGRCRTCKRKHHTSLCFGISHQSKQTNTNDHKSPDLEDTHVKYTPTSNPVLLKTAVGKVQCNGKITNVNILLDEGSQRSFITEEIAKKLTLNRDTCRKETIQLAAFGDKKARVQAMDIAHLKLQTLYGTVDISTLIVPKISTPVKNYVHSAVVNYAYLQELPLAQPVDRDVFGIDLLVGADYYWSIVVK